MQIQRLSAEIRRIDAESHRVTALVSTPHVDRHHTIFLPSAFEARLAGYLGGNPILLWGHRWDGGPQDAIGQAVAGRVTPDGLELTFEYAVAANPVAAQVWDLIVAGVIRAFSVGAYIIAEVKKNSPQGEIDGLPDYARDALKSGTATAVFAEVELVEVSQVLIGSNRESLVASVRSGLITAEQAACLAGETTEEIMSKVAENREGKAISAANSAKLEAAVGYMDQAAAHCREVMGGEPATEAAPEPRAAVTRMPTALYDVVGRLQTCADMLSASPWYDCDAEEQAETCDGVCAILQECVDCIQAMRPQPADVEPMGEPAEPAAMAATPTIDIQAFKTAIMGVLRENPRAALALLRKGSAA